MLFALPISLLCIAIILHAYRCIAGVLSGYWSVLIFTLRLGSAFHVRSFLFFIVSIFLCSTSLQRSLAAPPPPFHRVPVLLFIKLWSSFLCPSSSTSRDGTHLRQSHQSTFLSLRFGYMHLATNR